MNNFDFYNPVRVHFGPGTVKDVGLLSKEIGTKVCIVSYRNLGFLEPLCAKVVQLLEAEGIKVYTFFEAEPNPDITTIARGADFCRNNEVDLIIGLGGGSAMDAAKAVAAGVFYKAELWNMVYSRQYGTEVVPPEDALPMLMIPTLPATGSEMNQCSVVSNRVLKEKSFIWAECLYPHTAIIDPELTVSLPAYQTACAAADSISHVLEIYINGEEDSPLQHSFQEGVMRTVIDYVPLALNEPGNIDARANLQWAATCAINGWASPGDAWTPIHQVAHNLTSLFGVAHGASLSALMPAWMKSFSSRRKNRYLQFALNVMRVVPGGKSEDEIIAEGITAFEGFLKAIGVPVTLNEVGVKDTDLDSIIDGVKKVSFGEGGMLSCIPPVSAEDIKKMLKTAQPA
ncbi:MAG: iron-containing alcohol dehydrogenase [Spirochaetales bacterium]|uniref:Iron-containing alcohol dehydrogenase n=1 Tax=Candidatus Thalassospirochaeta sargassi TaxID=3119039 RepID=A0AAJ1IIH7_9SPIO|nr:iron-containing alcohol dehydrogenase [Spirochaetales bacterium]